MARLAEAGMRLEVLLGAGEQLRRMLACHGFTPVCWPRQSLWLLTGWAHLLCAPLSGGAGVRMAGMVAARRLFRQAAVELGLAGGRGGGPSDSLLAAH